jgi:hypothetical protein
MTNGTKSQSTKNNGTTPRTRAMRAAFGASVAAAAVLGSFASATSAHALTVGIGGGIGITVPLGDASVSIPILPSVDAGTITLPVIGSDGGIVIITLPIIVNDAGGITLPITEPDGGAISLPGIGADSGVTLTCESNATCGTGFHCDTDLQICLPTLSVGGACSELTGFLCASNECSDAGTCVPVSDAGSGSSTEDAGAPTSADNGGGSTGGGSGAGGGSAGDDSPGSSPGSTGGSATGSGSASAGGTGVNASADAGVAANADDGSDGSDGNGGCAVSPLGSSTRSHSVPFELVLGFVALVSFGAARRRRARAAR